MQDFVATLSRLGTISRRLPLACKIGIVLVALSVVSNIAFLVWHWDKPYDNPGGPLGDMGPWVLFWQVAHTVLRFSGMLCILISTAIVQHRREQLEKRSDQVEPIAR